MAANRYWVLAGLLVGGSAAHAAPRHRKPAVDATPAADPKVAAAGDAAADTRPLPGEDAAAPAEIADPPPPSSPAGWTFAVGPYIWASSVAIDVSFGPLSTGVELGFTTLVEHTRYGAELALEARHGRFGISADVMYGESAFEGSTEIASVMTTIRGTAGSLLLDTVASYAVLGGDAEMVSLEARSGVRYQRTTVQGELGAAGFALRTPEIVDDGADLIAGARAAVRPTRWLQVAGAFDVGVVGASDSTWSTTVEASARVASWFSVTAGWRSLTLQRASVKQELRGPRLALQLVF